MIVDYNNSKNRLILQKTDEPILEHLTNLSSKEFLQRCSDELVGVTASFLVNEGLPISTILLFSHFGLIDYNPILKNSCVLTALGTQVVDNLDQLNENKEIHLERTYSDKNVEYSTKPCS